MDHFNVIVHVWAVKRSVGCNVIIDLSFMLKAKTTKIEKQCCILKC